MASPLVAELARRISLGEDSTLELKSIRLAGGRVESPHRDDFADELAALALGIAGAGHKGVRRALWPSTRPTA